MISQGRHVVVQLDGVHLSAVSADVDSDRIRLRGRHTATCPGERAQSDADLLAWAAAQLKSWKLGRASVTFGVPRAEVVLKRLHLAGAADASMGDQARIVSLQMSRQLSLAMEDPVYDFVVLGNTPDGPSLDVLAAALPGAKLARLASLARAAGLRLRRVGLLAEGVCTLVANTAPDESGAVLGIGVGGSTTEFVIVDRGELRFARGSDVGIAGHADNWARLAEQIGVEAKRTWMSYRMSSDSSEVARVLVLGEREASAHVASRCARELEVPASTVDIPDLIEAAGDMSEDDRLLALPLAGLLAQDLAGAEHLDLAHPRRAPDRSGATRRRVMLAALGVIIAAGLAYVLSQGELHRLENRKNRLQGRWNEVRTEYADALRRHARAEHAEHFVRARADWIGHLRWLSDALPDPSDALIDQFRASLASTVTFRPRVTESGGKRVVQYFGGTWSHDQGIEILLDGRVRSRETADSLRDRLIDSHVYAVDTRGADAEDRFSFQLVTSIPDPSAPEGEGDAAEVAEGQGSSR